MIQRKNQIGFAVIIVVTGVAVTNTIRVRDAEIQSDRDLSTVLIRNYEQNVKKADDELRALESQSIAFDDLELISKLQTKIAKTSNLLIGLAPVIKYPGKVDKNSSASVDSFNKQARTYEENIRVYQSQMSELNSIIGRANKQYVIRIIKPLKLDRASLSSRRKFFEIIGLAQTPELAPSYQIEEINQGIAARSEQQKVIRDRWNSQAGKINQTNLSINSLRDEIYKLYGTTLGGIRVERAVDVKRGL